jgi:hypothetical protein
MASAAHTKKMRWNDCCNGCIVDQLETPVSKGVIMKGLAKLGVTGLVFVCAMVLTLTLMPVESSAGASPSGAAGAVGGTPGEVIVLAAVYESNPDYWLDKGAICYTYGNPQGALKYFKKAVELDPQNASAFYNQGICYAEMGQYQEAISAISKAIEIEPRGIYFYGRGTAYLLSGDKDTAVQDFEQASALGDPDAQAYLEDLSKGR